MTTAETRAIKIRVSQIIFQNLTLNLKSASGQEHAAVAREVTVHANLESPQLKGEIEVLLLPEEQTALARLMRQIEERLEAEF